MEYLKQCIQLCCHRCFDKKHKESDASSRIILPPSRRSSINPSGPPIPITYTYLAQPGFAIPSDDSYNCLTLPVPPTAHRKHSSPSVLTSIVPIQLKTSTSSLFDSTASITDTQICIEEVDENWNNNSANERLWRCDSVPSVPTNLSPTRQKPMKRLSLAAIQANHSRRSSMSSFDISKDEVDSDLYDSSELLPDADSNGRLCFSINYDQDFEQLTIHVIGAKSLWQQDQSSAVRDSFVKVSLLPPHKRKGTKMCTAVHRDNPNPVYNERFTYENISTSASSTLHIKFVVYTYDKSGRKKSLGTIVHKYDCENNEQKYSDTKIWRHFYSEGMKTGEKGNVLLTMKYQPSEGQLHLNVVKATQLETSDQERTLQGLYIKAALVAHGKILQKKKTQPIQPASSDMTFDENIVFTLPSTMIDQSCLLVSICGKTNSSKRVHLGYVSLGPPFFANGTGLEQWTKMLSMPHTSIGKWHRLSVWSKKDSPQNLINECNMF